MECFTVGELISILEDYPKQGVVMIAYPDPDGFTIDGLCGHHSSGEHVQFLTSKIMDLLKKSEH